MIINQPNFELKNSKFNYDVCNFDVKVCDFNLKNKILKENISIKCTNMSVSKYIPLNITYLREKNNFNKSELARRLGGLSPQMVGRYESGETIPPLDKIDLMGEIFGIDPIDIIRHDLRNEPYNKLEESRVEYEKMTPLIKSLGECQEERDRLKALIEKGGWLKTNTDLGKELK
jgi:transcriptional regulator with XRE-family HTH domain